MLISSFLLVCISGCVKSQPVTLYNRAFESVVSVQSGKNNKYDLKYKGVGNCCFIPKGDSAQIDFVWENNLCTLKVGELSLETQDELINKSYPYIIKFVLDRSYNEQCLPDAAGIYALRGSANFGEYTLIMNELGLPQSIILSKGIKFTFSNVKI